MEPSSWNLKLVCPPSEKVEAHPLVPITQPGVPISGPHSAIQATVWASLPEPLLRAGLGLGAEG